MDYHKFQLSRIATHTGDLPQSLLAQARHAGIVALDIETSGLSWKNDEIGTCQIYIPDHQVAIIRIDGTLPHRLGLLLEDTNICKLFHHAMFDLRFMVFKWSFEVHNVACTKIASKILSPSKQKHSLKNLVREYLEVHLTKRLQTSDWLSSDLSQEQLQYAAKDVYFLPELFSVLKTGLEEKGRWQLAVSSFEYLPTRVHLDILGSGDVFKY